MYFLYLYYDSIILRLNGCDSCIEIAKSSTKSKNQLLYIEFEEAAIDPYNESLLSIQKFNTKFNFYRLNLELYKFKFFTPIFPLIYK